MGFTLIEILVVISIIGMLSSVILASLKTARQKAVDSKFMQEMAGLRNAISYYRINHNDIPRCPDTNCALLPTDQNSPQNPAGAGLETVLAPLIADKFYTKIPHYSGWNAGTFSGNIFSYISYYPGWYRTSIPYIEEGACGALASADWKPGTLPGILLFTHDIGHDFGLTHTYSACQAAQVGGIWSGACYPTTQANISCMTLR